MMTIRRCIPFVVAFAVTLVLVVVWLSPARAENITVTTTDDVLDAADNCAAVTVDDLPGDDTVTSLREAMCAANNSTHPDTIPFNIPGCESGCAI